MTSTSADSPLEPSYRPLGPGSATWRSIDWRTLLGSRAILLLEVAHPVVGAGVYDHSEFLSDRWARITRTLAAVRRYSGFHGPDAAIAEGQRLREVHRDIAGTDSKGRSYHALNADAYLWVHATAYSGAYDVRRVFGGLFDDEGEDAIFREWQDVARILRIPERVIPPTRKAFWEYYEYVIDHTLERNEATDMLIELDRHPMPPPPGLRLPVPVWNAAAVPLATLLRLTTAGLLPEQVRDRIGIEWSTARSRRFDRAVKTVRVVDRVMPDRVRHPVARRTKPISDSE